MKITGNENDLTLGQGAGAQSASAIKSGNSNTLALNQINPSSTQDTLSVSEAAKQLAAQEAQREGGLNVINTTQEALNTADWLADAIAADGQKAMAAYSSSLHNGLVNLLK